MRGYPNVFTFNYTKRYYLFHPWKWVKEFFAHFRYAWRRATRGWTWEDAWNWDTWFETIAPEMLRHLADHCCGYNDQEYDTIEEYQADVRQLAEDIELLNWEAYQARYNQYYKGYEDSLVLPANARETITRRYFDAEKDLIENYKQHKKDTFATLEYMLDMLWD